MVEIATDGLEKSTNPYPLHNCWWSVTKLICEMVPYCSKMGCKLANVVCGFKPPTNKRCGGFSRGLFVEDLVTRVVSMSKLDVSNAIVLVCSCNGTRPTL